MEKSTFNGPGIVESTSQLATNSAPQLLRGR